MRVVVVNIGLSNMDGQDLGSEKSQEFLKATEDLVDATPGLGIFSVTEGVGYFLDDELRPVSERCAAIQAFAGDEYTELEESRLQTLLSVLGSQYDQISVAYMRATSQLVFCQE